MTREKDTCRGHRSTLHEKEPEEPESVTKQRLTISVWAYGRRRVQVKHTATFYHMELPSKRSYSLRKFSLQRLKIYSH